MKQKLDSVKKWLKDPVNRENLTVGVFLTAVSAGFVTLMYAVVKSENQAIAEHNKQVNEYRENQQRMEDTVVSAHNAGKLVYALQDGSFLSLDKEANPQILTW